jgi:hypothetical protein
LPTPTLAPVQFPLSGSSQDQPPSNEAVRLYAISKFAIILFINKYLVILKRTSIFAKTNVK